MLKQTLVEIKLKTHLEIVHADVKTTKCNYVQHHLLARLVYCHRIQYL